MKKVKIIIGLAIVCVLTCSFIMLAIPNKESQKQKNVSWGFENSWNKNGTLINSLKNNPLNHPIHELKEYEYSRFVSSAHLQSFDDFDDSFKKSISSKISTLYLFNKSFPVEHIQIIDDENICVVYKLKKNDSSIYAYVIFRKQTQELEASETIKESGTYEIWHNYGEYYLVSKNNKSSDYTHIKVGDKLSEKDAFDLAIHLNSLPQKLPINSENAEVVNVIRHAVCLMEDGILVLTIEHNSGDVNTLSNYTISEIDFYNSSSKDTQPYKFAIMSNNFSPILP